jgi:hypothetical protein
MIGQGAKPLFDALLVPRRFPRHSFLAMALVNQ